MANPYPNDVLYHPEEVYVLEIPSQRATALASQLNNTGAANMTDFNQNYLSSMVPSPAARLWTGNAVRQPNLTSFPQFGPKPSDLADYFRNLLYRVQDKLAGSA